MRSGQADDTPDLSSWFKANYSPTLLRLAWFCTKDRYLAEDIAQDASVKIIKAWPDDQQRHLILTSPRYVRTIVVNAFKSYLKNPSRTNNKEIPYDAKLDKQLRFEPDVELRLAVLELEEDQRTMILLRYEGNEIVTAGRLLGLSRDQAYELNRKAMESLGELLEDKEEG